MSCKCHKCGRQLSSKQKLHYHLHKKKIPCDFKCRVCGVQLKDRHQYYRHRKKEHPEPKEPSNAIVVEEPTTSAVRITPIEDFRWRRTLDKRSANVGDYEVTVETFQEITIKKLPREEATRGMLLETSGPSIICALKQLDNDRDPYLESTLAGLLPNVHIKPEIPELHSICLSDIARRSVSFYSRPVEGEDCRWIVHPQESSLRVLTQHARDLFSCLLETGVSALVIQVWRGEEVVLTMKPERDFGGMMVLVSYERDYDHIRVQVGMFEHELTECPETRSEEAAQILRIIEDRKNQVLEDVKKIIPDREHINRFLNQGRPICYPTLLASQNQ